jgi:hypothetical protein
MHNNVSISNSITIAEKDWQWSAPFAANILSAMTTRQAAQRCPV